jgi:hypothetical protein
LLGSIAECLESANVTAIGGHRTREPSTNTCAYTYIFLSCSVRLRRSIGDIVWCYRGWTMDYHQPSAITQDTLESVSCRDPTSTKFWVQWHVYWSWRCRGICNVGKFSAAYQSQHTLTRLHLQISLTIRANIFRTPSFGAMMQACEIHSVKITLFLKPSESLEHSNALGKGYRPCLR